jgi:hypothetical protein
MKFNLASVSFRSAFRLLVGLFFLMFLLRFAFSFQDDGDDLDDIVGLANQTGSYFDNQSDLRKNYATEKNAPQQQSGMPAEASQKYEKTASLSARTDEFENDETRLRQMSQNFSAIIQYEQRSGNPGKRSLHLMIGVRPELFDSFYVVAQRIGHIYANTVTKVDKTTEFRELNAKRASLEKALASLTDLKSRAGSISDLVGLHDKILDIERQMQELGVQLGNFSAENEFCTVRFSLYENAAARTISLAGRLFDAFMWTLQYYLLVLVGLALALGVAWLFVSVAAKAESFVKKEQEQK